MPIHEHPSCAGTGDLSELDLAEDLAARSRAHLLTAAAAAAAAPEEPQARGSKLSASSGAALDRWQSSPSEAVLGFKHRVKTGFGSTPQVLTLQYITCSRCSLRTMVVA